MKKFTGNSVVSLAVVLFLTGCATNWESKIGTCSYNDVAAYWSQHKVTAPESKKVLSNGNLEVKWYVFDYNMLFTPADRGAPEIIPVGHRETFLFDTNMVLKAHHTDR